MHRGKESIPPFPIPFNLENTAVSIYTSVIKNIIDFMQNLSDILDFGAILTMLM